MGKKSSTVHLENSTWQEINEYMKENDISSRNDAIERMLLERRLLLKMTINPSNISNTNINNDKQNPVIVKEEDILQDSISDIFNRMS